MDLSAAMAPRPTSARERIIVALDVSSEIEARRVIGDLEGIAGAFKVGMHLFTAAGPNLVRDLTSSGHRIFLDLKFHDIPNTVAKAGIAAAELGVWMFNVHAAGGGEMMSRCISEVSEYCERNSSAKPLIIGVTVLTSSNDETLSEIGIVGPPAKQVVRLAGLAAAAGLDGVVASPREVGMIRAAIKDPAFLTVTPGIRATSATNDDQKRVTTIGEAFANGSDYVVIGRPILEAADRGAALKALIADAEALQ
ncbi:MAG TPA: orotidine-5'-phosphate decarboxylase [Pyrinomonadaceae bacterium]|jgi:orotidine-5'-phosphate decarboxylase|nr:orotidine-5'-phosphate decarboxylase [Pyrinomonadaceae bacterium]